MNKITIVLAMLVTSVSASHAGEKASSIHPECRQFKGKKQMFCHCALTNGGQLGMRSGRLAVLPLANRNSATDDAHVACLKRAGFN